MTSARITRGQAQPQSNANPPESGPGWFKTLLSWILWVLLGLVIMIALFPISAIVIHRVTHMDIDTPSIAPVSSETSGSSSEQVNQIQQEEKLNEKLQGTSTVDSTTTTVEPENQKKEVTDKPPSGEASSNKPEQDTKQEEAKRPAADGPKTVKPGSQPTSRPTKGKTQERQGS